MNHKIFFFVLSANFLFPSLIFAQDSTNRVNTQSTTRVLPPPTDKEVQNGARAIRIPKEIKVPPEWIPILNRAYEEYWLEGNHKPDAGFVLFARNPSKETAKLWLLRMESKAQNLEELFGYIKDAQKELVNSGLMIDRFNMVNKSNFPPIHTKNIKENSKKDSEDKKNLSDLNFYFLFSPTCPHCATLAQNLIGFPNVYPLQVTGGDLHHWQGLPKSEHATSETIDNYIKDGDQPSGVPVLAIHHPKTDRIIKIRGSRTTQEILTAAAAVQK